MLNSDEGEIVCSNLGTNSIKETLNHIAVEEVREKICAFERKPCFSLVNQSKLSIPAGWKVY